MRLRPASWPALPDSANRPQSILWQTLSYLDLKKSVGESARAFGVVRSHSMNGPDQTSLVAVDVGGTFTDCVALAGNRITVAKVATTADQSEAVLSGAGSLAGEGRFDGLVHGSTVATNALLEWRGAHTVLVTDEGFEDVIEIGRQERPSLYDSFADRPPPLVSRDDRLAIGPDLAGRVSERSPSSVAVCLAYSYNDPAPEEDIARLLAASGVPVSLSSRVAAEFREFERASTTVLNAYLWPAVAGYLTRLAHQARTVARGVQVMRSSGGLMEVDAAATLAAALLLSGPAGGVVAAAAMARARDYRRVVTFDMGGTSTDVCRIEDGRPGIEYQRTIAGYVCRMPSVAVHTVGAGGGSIAWVDPGGSLRVGPHSAGSSPGPACYGQGGRSATVTDAHLALGRIDPATPLGGTLAVDANLARSALTEVGTAVGLDVDAFAEGMVEVVESHMERAIRAVSIEQGADPRRATLVAFGGAGGLHATSLARRLGMPSVAIPPYGGVFSAIGLLMAPPRHDGARSVMIAVEGGRDFLAAVAAISARVGEAYVAAHGHRPATLSAVVDMRYHGQAHEIAVPLQLGDGFDAAARRFHRIHRDINGFARPDEPVEVVTVRAVAEGLPLLGWGDLPILEEGPTPTPGVRPVVIGGRTRQASLWSRVDLPAGAALAGPAVISEEVGTTVLLPGDRATVAVDGTIEVEW